MKLYDVNDYTKVKLLEDGKIPPAALPVIKDDIVIFHEIDGMYGKCINKDGDVVYIAAWTEVEIINK